MSVIDSVTMALKNIVTSKMRTFLTMLGIIIGVGAVIIIVGLGNGLEDYVTSSFSTLGTNSLTVTVQSRGATRTLSVDDFYKLIEKNSEYFEYCSPTAQMRGTMKIGTETPSKTTVNGVSEDYLEIKGYEIVQGRGFQYSDMASRANVCVIGQWLNRTYFGGRAVGDYVRIGYTKLQVIGVVEQQGDELSEGGTDDFLLVPYTTASRTSGRVSNYTVTVRDQDRISECKTVLENALFDYFDSENFYTVISMAEILDTITSIINIMVSVLAGIAAISLVVGGIGIMNIMLVSVTERTREIGIRKSLGAKERYILEQFVIEAATTSALGGIVGILLGYGASALATKLIDMLTEYDLAVTPNSGSVLLAFGISVGIGILFGYLPARKAARLNPIDALRYD